MTYIKAQVEPSPAKDRNGSSNKSNRMPCEQSLSHFMQDIIDKYGENAATRYLLPIINDPSADERTQYKNAICRINVALKEVASLAGLHQTMHVARHCWGEYRQEQEHISTNYLNKNCKEQPSPRDHYDQEGMVSCGRWDSNPHAQGTRS